MLKFLDSMYRVAQGKTPTTWGELKNGNLVAYEGYIYMVIGSERENEVSKYLLQIAEEMSEFSPEQVDDLLDVKDYSKLTSRITKRSLGPDEEIEILKDTFTQYVTKLQKLIPNVDLK